MTHRADAVTQLRSARVSPNVIPPLSELPEQIEVDQVGGRMNHTARSASCSILIMLMTLALAISGCSADDDAQLNGDTHEQLNASSDEPIGNRSKQLDTDAILVANAATAESLFSELNLPALSNGIRFDNVSVLVRSQDKPDWAHVDYAFFPYQAFNPNEPAGVFVVGGKLPRAYHILGSGDTKYRNGGQEQADIKNSSSSIGLVLALINNSLMEFGSFYHREAT